MRLFQHSRGGIRTLVLALALGVSLPAVAAEDYPTRPIEMIVTWGPGGGADKTGRMLGKLLEPKLKVSIPVDNVAGSSGVTGLMKLVGGTGDGYQVGILTADTLALLADPKPQRWSLKDITPIAILTVQRSGFFTRVGGPFKSWADVEAKAKTAEFKVAVTGLGTPDDIAADFLRKRGLKIVSVPYAKPSERYAAVIGGHADLLYEQAGDVRSFIEGKQMAPVLFLADARVKEFPDVPTSKEIGLGVTSLDQFRLIAVKSNTPPDRLKVLVEKTTEAVKSAEFTKYLEGEWADPSGVITGDAARVYVEREIEALKKMIK